MAIETVPFDPADFLHTPEEVAQYLDEALASGDAAFIARWATPRGRAA